MTKQEIYEQIVQLTSELHATNVAEKIFSAAKEGDHKKVEEVFETFKKENPDLYDRIAHFGAKVSVVDEIFTSENDEEYGSYVFDSNTINAVDLYALLLFGGIDELYLFDWGTKSSENYVDAIELAGYDELAHFVDNEVIYNYFGEGKDYKDMYECLVGIFKGEFE